MALTEKRKRFVEEYLIDLNATQAVLRAGYNTKSVKTAGEIGKQLLQIPEIREYVEEQLVILKSARIAQADEVLQYLTRVLRDEDVEEVIVVESLGDGGGSQARHIDKRLASKDRLKAAELLSKYWGLLVDRKEVSGPDGGPVQVESKVDYSKYSTEDLEALNEIYSRNAKSE